MGASGPEAEEAVRLAARGLDLYGQGRAEEAAAAWRRALALDPGQEEARDYLRTAGFLDEEGPPAGPAGRPTPPEPACPEALLRETAELVARGDGREALGLLLAIAGEEDDLDVQARVELLRAHLFAELWRGVAQGSAVPALRVEAAELPRFPLSRDAAFLLSLVDGATPVGDLVAVSGMDPFHVLDTLVRLEEGGLLGWGTRDA